MARQNLVNEFNTFVGGFITEASPLTFPPNSALDITNFKISKTGPLTRRLGIDYEPNYIEIDSTLVIGVGGELAINNFSWDNAGGDPEKSLIVIQVGNRLDFFDTDTNPITGNLIHTHTFTSIDNNTDLSAAVVDGVLVVATGKPELSSFVYDSGTITEDTYRLKVRDFFGVEDIVNGDDLRSPADVVTRPLSTDVTDTHIYNLRNSTYSQLRVRGNDEDIKDPINSFLLEYGDLMVEAGIQRFPSNADSVTSALFADANDSDDRITERFFPNSLIKSPRGNFESPKGYFIIDALDRGTSRIEEVTKLQNTSSEYIWNVTQLPLDRTPNGATVVKEFAGRVFYGGFSGEVVDGDKHSPRLSSYLLFSNLVNSTADLSTCHQIGDPTSKESPDLLDTDGGTLRLAGAYGIQEMVNLGSKLVVVASNGVWVVEGGNNFGFTATDFKVSKITEHGCNSPGSVVQVDSSILYWGDDGIYSVSPNEVGDLVAVNMTETTIQTYYDDIPELDKVFAKGHFDSYERSVRWVFGNRFSSVGDTNELIFDVNLSAFYKNSISGVSGRLPLIKAPVEVPPFKVGAITENVVYNGEQVQYDGVDVVYTSNIKVSGVRELMYLTITQTAPTVKYTLSRYSDSSYTDWKSFDTIGVDAAAELITGYEGAGDFQRYKQVPSITFHFERTEDGFAVDSQGDIFPTNESSCKVQAQWEWANSANSNRWGREFQAYRYRRLYMPEDVNDPYDTGFEVISTKNKLRGKGKVLSLFIKTEPLKDCRLLGWSTITSVAVNV